MSQNDSPATQAAALARDETIALAREELRITRHAADRGGMRVRVSVHEREETLDVLLREQDVQVERVPIGRVVEHVPETRQEGDVLVIPILEEVLIVERRLVLKEEIRVRRSERQRPIKETARLRAETAVIEPIIPSIL